MPVSSHYADVLWDFQFANVCAVEGTASAALRARSARIPTTKKAGVFWISDCSSSMDRLAVQGVGILRDLTILAADCRQRKFPKQDVYVPVFVLYMIVYLYHILYP